MANLPVDFPDPPQFLRDGLTVLTDGLSQLPVSLGFADRHHGGRFG
jgi:hypothetical protein